ncbi:hypothetical protein HYW76_05045 [Candidatus Pacearchaeota archaeon]|nr:hypothetical protein [Candidatus Pacearchaeota archaeon]
MGDSESTYQRDYMPVLLPTGDTLEVTLNSLRDARDFVMRHDGTESSANTIVDVQEHLHDTHDCNYDEGRGIMRFIKKAERAS